MVPSPKPEKNVSIAVTNATIDMIIISIRTKIKKNSQ